MTTKNLTKGILAGAALAGIIAGGTFRASEWKRLSARQTILRAGLTGN